MKRNKLIGVVLAGAMILATTGGVVQAKTNSKIINPTITNNILLTQHTQTKEVLPNERITNLTVTMINEKTGKDVIPTTIKLTGKIGKPINGEATLEIPEGYKLVEVLVNHEGIGTFGYPADTFKPSDLPTKMDNVNLNVVYYVEPTSTTVKPVEPTKPTTPETTKPVEPTTPTKPEVVKPVEPTKPTKPEVVKPSTDNNGQLPDTGLPFNNTEVGAVIGVLGALAALGLVLKFKK
ncbi:MAG: hypothetical protein ACRCWG_10895 [Sarcina sp.]